MSGLRYLWYMSESVKPECLVNAELLMQPVQRKPALEVIRCPALLSTNTSVSRALNPRWRAMTSTESSRAFPSPCRLLPASTMIYTAMLFVDSDRHSFVGPNNAAPRMAGPLLPELAEMATIVEHRQNSFLLNTPSSNSSKAKPSPWMAASRIRRSTSRRSVTAAARNVTAGVKFGGGMSKGKSSCCRWSGGKVSVSISGIWMCCLAPTSSWKQMYST